MDKLFEKAAKLTGPGILMELAGSKKSEEFDNGEAGTGVGVAGLVVLVFFLIVFLIVIPWASYNVMGKKIGHAILALFFGVLYVMIVWLWAGLFTKYQLR